LIFKPGTKNSSLARTSFVRDFRVNDAETPADKLLISGDVG
jgi:hypothetical protein